MNAEALYRLELGAIGRTKGPSLPAATAYVIRSVIQDTRQDMKWDYRRKRDLMASGVSLPDDAPSLWASVQHVVAEMDKAEKRKDATTAKTATLTLPRGFTKEQQVAVVEGFIRREITARGLVCIWGIHNPAALDGQEQPHAHLIISTRKLENGNFSAKKIDWLTNPKAVECRDETIALRESWAHVLNYALRAAGRKERVTHMSRDQQRTLAAEIAADEARTLAERSTAAAKVIVLTETTAEAKIGHSIVAQARREVEQIARRTGEVVSLADHLARRSPAAAAVFAQRAERRAVNERLASSIWTAEDQVALDAELAAAAQAKAAAEKAQADAAAAEARRRAEAEAIAQTAERQLAADRERLGGALGRLEAAMTARHESSAALRAAEDRTKREAAQRARDAAALAAKLRLDRAAEEAGWRRINELGASLEHGDGRTIVLAPSVAAVAGYDTIKPGMRALIASDEARAKEPTLLRALFSRELEAAKTAGRRVVALIERGAQAFATWAREAAPHAEQILPPDGAETWASLAPPPDLDLPDADRDDDSFRPT